MKTDIGDDMPIIVDFNYEPADDTVGWRHGIEIISVLLGNTHYYIQDVLSDEVLDELRHECLAYYEAI